jgi:hypothetical protein
MLFADQALVGACNFNPTKIFIINFFGCRTRSVSAIGLTLSAEQGHQPHNTSFLIAQSRILINIG